MDLSTEEHDLLSGGAGVALQTAMEYQLQLGEFFGAKRFVPISNAHFMGDFEVMDTGGVAFLESLAESGATVRVPTTRNATCVDPLAAAQFKQRSELVQNELRIGPLLRSLGILTVNTCIGYQTVYTPRLGERVAWGDTGTVAYANSVLGARTNYEAGPASLFSALTGRTPEYGFQLAEHRRGNIHCRVEAALDDWADWGALGQIIGTRYRGYANIPVFEIDSAFANPDALKHLGASLASYGSMAMFHAVGMTPEAPSVGAAIDGRQLLDTVVVTQQDIQDVYDDYDVADGAIDLAVFTAPQLSLAELQHLATLIGDRRIHPGVEAIVTTNAMVGQAASAEGIANAFSRAGVTLVHGTCWYIMDPAEMQRQFGWKRLVTNSAKLANIIKAHGYQPVLRRTDECIEAAIAGKVI
jgi:hypothetical protein